MVRLGQRLKEQRLQRGLSLDEVSKAIKIRSDFLVAIERGDYKKLPSSAYAYGFVRNYAEYLGFSKREALALFRREFDEDKIYKVLPEGLARDDFPLKRLRLQQTVYIVIAVLLILGSFLTYQFRYAFINPPLEVTSPKQNQVLSSQSVVVSGKTVSDTTVYINDDPVTVLTDGSFKKTITVFPGEDTIKIKVLNRFGKQTTLERTIKVE